jgi:hypothetical protein
VRIVRPAQVPIGSLLAGFGQDGALGRNTFRAMGINNTDLSLSRTFRMREKLQTTLRVEAFNLFNHRQFGIPVRILEAPGFGASADTLTLPRTIQLALRLAF